MDPQFIYSLASCAEACGYQSVMPELGVLLDNPDLPDDNPAVIAVVGACANIPDDLALVLLNKGWTRPPGQSTGARLLQPGDLNYVGYSVVNAGKSGFQYGVDHQLCVVPDQGILISNKGGSIGWMEDAWTIGQPAKWKAPIWDLASEGKALTINAGTLGGMAYDPTSGLVWAALEEFYNVSGADNLGLVCFDPDLTNPQIQGAWRVGPSGVSWQCLDVPGLNCSAWVDPLTLEIFHANKTHEWVCAVPAKYRSKVGKMASGRVRPGHAFGSGAGPSLYGWLADPKRAPGGHQSGIPLMAYPAGSKTWLPNYRKAEGDDTGTGARWLETPGGVEAVLLNYTKAAGFNWYGQPGPPDNPEKGWHVSNTANMQPGPPWGTWRSMLFLYDPADLVSVADGLKEPWDVQPYAEIDLSADLGVAPGTTREGPFLSSIDVDYAAGLLYGIEPKAAGNPTEVRLHAWKIPA